MVVVLGTWRHTNIDFSVHLFHLKEQNTWGRRRYIWYTQSFQFNFFHCFLMNDDNTDIILFREVAWMFEDWRKWTVHSSIVSLPGLPLPQANFFPQWVFPGSRRLTFPIWNQSVNPDNFLKHLTPFPVLSPFSLSLLLHFTLQTAGHSSLMLEGQTQLDSKTLHKDTLTLQKSLHLSQTNQGQHFLPLPC